MSQSLDLPKNITSFYFWCKIQVLLYIQMKSASHTSIITALKFTCCSSLSVSYQQIIVLYIGHCITICGPEFQRTSVIAYSCFCLLYKCFSFMRRTLFCWHHCFKFNGNDWLRNRDGGVSTCSWTLVTVKLCWNRYWYTGIIHVSLRLPNLVSFFCKNEGKRRSVIAFKIVIGLCYISHLCHEHNSNGFWVLVSSKTFGHKSCICSTIDSCRLFNK